VQGLRCCSRIRIRILRIETWESDATKSRDKSTDTQIVGSGVGCCALRTLVAEELAEGGIQCETIALSEFLEWRELKRTEDL